MTTRPSTLSGHDHFSGAGAAIAAVVLFQLATTLSKPLMDQIGAPAVTWLRMVAAAAILLIFIRPKLLSLPRRSVWAALCLGATLAAMSLAAFSAVERLPIGMVATIGFLGPLILAVLGATGARLLALGLAALAGLGVVLMLVPIGGSAAGAGWIADPVGIAISLLYAGFWALYMVLTRRVGQMFSGRDGLCLSFVAAALILAPFGVADMAQEATSVSLVVVAGALLLGLLAPCLSAGLEMRALRRLNLQAFGILMSLEPAIATILGMAFLGEVPGVLQSAGMICVSAASAAAVLLPAPRPKDRAAAARITPEPGKARASTAA